MKGKTTHVHIHACSPKNQPRKNTSTYVEARNNQNVDRRQTAINPEQELAVMATKKMRVVNHRFLLAFFFLWFFISYGTEETEKSPLAEANALLGLKASFDNTVVDHLSTWTNTSIPCGGKIPWIGIMCFDGVVHGLRLGKMNLSGKIDIDALSELHGLRTVSFINNYFSGTIPNFKRLRHLKAIYISNNLFEGFIHDEFFNGMTHLKKLWIPGNAFTGIIPSSIGKMTTIMELHLENNQFSGNIPNVEKMLRLKSFNVSNNKLSGDIPERFVMFGATSFSGNEGLCGKPLSDCGVGLDENEVESGKIKVGVVAFLVTVLFAVLFLLMIRKNDKPVDNDGFTYIGKQMRRNKEWQGVTTHNKYQNSSGTNRRRNEWDKKGPTRSSLGTGDGLVVVNGEKGMNFGLPDLMKASAEVLGNGSLGSSFKAVIANGMSVVVKRMKEMNRLESRAFYTEMKRLGLVRHPNVHTPIAFHYRNEEKLVVYEYLEKGSLLNNLHGDRGPNHAALDWPTRLSIIQGITHGLHHLHEKFPDSEVPHGNFTSGNILLSPNLTPLIVDYGYIPFVSPSRVKTSFFAYKTPEFIKKNVVSLKSDVYCLGIVILEVLTGKYPSQYVNINGKGGTNVVEWASDAVKEKKEDEILDQLLVENRGSVEIKGMKRLLRLAVELVKGDPARRPALAEVMRRVDNIADDAGTTRRRNGGDCGFGVS